MPSGTPVSEAFRFALARERALVRERRRGDVVHVLPPAELRGGVTRNRARRFLLSGALIESGPGAGSGRIIDAAAGACGLTRSVSAIRRSAAGGALVFGMRADGARVLLRVGGAGWPGDPIHGHDALRALGERPLVPIPLETGELAGAAWTLETALPGVRPRRLDRRISDTVARFAGDLPRATGRPASVERDLGAIASALPSRADRLRDAIDRAAELAIGVTAIARHGDMWLGNLLVRDRWVSGVVDWDAWTVDGVPGADVLHLYATDLALTSGRELGEVFIGAPWRSEAFRSFSAGYWPALGVAPGSDLLFLAGIAWWAAAVAGTLARAPHRAHDERWLAANVDRVVERIPKL